MILQLVYFLRRIWHST